MRAKRQNRKPSAILRVVFDGELGLVLGAHLSVDHVGLGQALGDTTQLVTGSAQLIQSLDSVSSKNGAVVTLFVAATLVVVGLLGFLPSGKTSQDGVLALQPVDLTHVLVFAVGEGALSGAEVLGQTQQTRLPLLMDDLSLNGFVTGLLEEGIVVGVNRDEVVLVVVGVLANASRHVTKRRFVGAEKGVGVTKVGLQGTDLTMGVGELVG